jgi:para-nitrobenzyl esterase
MAERGDAVVVTIQYRLGPLGFLVHPGLEQENPNGVSGNYAVLDQILALTWIKNNISGFGGDPSKVMVFGESAGGVNIGNLLVSPLAAGLFQRACIESAVPVINLYSDSKNKGISYADGFTTVGSVIQKIAYLRSLPADSLIKSEPNVLSSGVVQMKWQPVVDHVVFMDFPARIVQGGSYNKVPLMIGSNSEEMSLSAPPAVLPSMVTALINTTFSPALRPQATILYPPGSNASEARKSYVGLLTDGQFTTPVRRTAQCISLNQTEPVWRYFFTYKHSIPILETLGSYHGMELFYIFNNWENAALGKGFLFKPQDDSVQNAMLHYWVNFANSGNPNGSGLVSWPQYQSETDCYLEIKATPDGSQKGVRTVQSDLWDDAIGYVGCTSSLNITNVTVNDAFRVFPNPTDGLVYITSQETGILTVSLFDFTGRKILSKTNVNQLDLSGYSDGIYLLMINQNGKILKREIVKQ